MSLEVAAWSDGKLTFNVGIDNTTLEFTARSESTKSVLQCTLKVILLSFCLSVIFPLASDPKASLHGIVTVWAGSVRAKGAVKPRDSSTRAVTLSADVIYALLSSVLSIMVSAS